MRKGREPCPICGSSTTIEEGYYGSMLIELNELCDNPDCGWFYDYTIRR